MDKKLKGRSWVLFLLFAIILILNTSFAYSIELNVANSKDWRDVFSVMLYSSLKGESATFLNSESLAGFTSVVKEGTDINVYESQEMPYIPNLKSQLSIIGFNVLNEVKGKRFNLELVPKGINKFIVVSSDNYRLLPSLASFAITNKYWVFIVDETNVDEVESYLKKAQEVIAVGNFRRDLANRLQPYFDKWINHESIFRDSIELAESFSSYNTVVLSDGFSLESEYFRTTNPVLIVGSNKLVDDVYNFLVKHNVKSVVVVGNSLATVGEQIRTKSNKTISVFIKFGQADAQNTGKIYALTFFPLPAPKLFLEITNVIYDPQQKKLIVYFKNSGNVGIYELTTVSVKNGDDELASASQTEAVFIGARETLPVSFDMELPVAELSNNTQAVFYTSFGLTPVELDNYLTLPGKYVPPYITSLKVKELDVENLNFDIVDVAYYPSLNRIGIDMINNGSAPVYYSLRIKDLIINGLPETLSKEGVLQPSGSVERVYISAKLDEVDMEENKQFNLIAYYGPDEETKISKLEKTFEFKTASAGFLTGFFSFDSAGSISLIAIIGAVILFVVVLFIRKKAKSNIGY
ncbi:MAG: hypothetical protein PWP03_810 [Candidatus Woesearchaeota archaeon]|nr:hypothetical protein [Candidatus Woesearchaeota archaeon]MDN5328172.1 hypothetical protein [Candidatus Woesearchaeota archaeon]